MSRKGIAVFRIDIEIAGHGFEPVTPPMVWLNARVINTCNVAHPLPDLLAGVLRPRRRVLVGLSGGIKDRPLGLRPDELRKTHSDQLWVQRNNPKIARFH